ncbi:DUF6778 family protein [Litoreibacter roseus]|uniref:Lipoprotein n=1 Tax=Litoreibacter roseus TaxID=2601869 RepID=A0A6N6JAR3_9RHOB|nr:DUF6778 family protein [Litoreibacter roseus]GFE63333.1 hypothetical protein KIN_04070 [Litoreibacter roseus]
MIPKRLFILFTVLLAVAGCSSTWETKFDEQLDPAVTRGWNVQDIDIVIPDQLTVSNTNRYFVDADIVWHDDEFGDRRKQVATVLEDGLREGLNDLNGSRPVNFRITLTQFHALSPRARTNAPSAVHNITFYAQVFDARTGKLIVPADLIQADIEALTGFRAREAEERGETQKVRIKNHLANVIRGWAGIGPDPRRSFTTVGR